MTLRNPARTAFNQADIFTAATVACLTTQWIEFGRITGIPGAAYALGYGLSEGQDSANGRILMILKKAGAVQVQGDLRICLLDALDKVVKIVWEGRTEQVAYGSTDRTLQLPFPLIPDAVGENFKIVFLIKADTADTLTKADSVILLDATVYEDK